MKNFIFTTIIALIFPASVVGQDIAATGELRYAGKILTLSTPCSITSEADAITFVYRWPKEPTLEVSLRHTETEENGTKTSLCRVNISSSKKLGSDLTVSLASGLGPLPTETWLPLYNGTGATLRDNSQAAYLFAGTLPAEGIRLALPMVSVPSGSQRLTLATDTDFSTLFTSDAIEWTYPAAVGLENGVGQRTIVLVRHEGTPEQSLDHFFRTILSDVAPGPPWLHEIALVGYDYMSDGGEGWFRDIDALCNVIPEKERSQVFLCCHGWYDYLGRYCFDERTGQLDQEWTAFSNYEVVREAHPFGNIGGDQVPMGFGECKPVKMSLSQVHARLAYAKSRGFRVGLYFADGTNAGEGLENFEPDRVLRWGGWQGPDSKGRSYIQNPLHPKVRDFFLNYTRALLDEFGEEIDALNWDETFHIAVGQLGSDAVPGYADLAMMRLTREITQIVDEYNRTHDRQIAFLTSDCLGAVIGHESGPYALAAHGTLQDSWCQPDAWSYGIFPNYRNILWSCCWWPVSKWSWIDFAVRHHQSPVVISNGWGDNTGFAEMTPQQRARVIDLFNWRKDKPTRLQWFEQLPVKPETF
ncbi:MAG: hypothetical protein FWC43_02000 [Planctomycetaceae bacterium]|nr:hypothetical protein [Planctomycetaceae bacterium]